MLLKKLLSDWFEEVPNMFFDVGEGCIKEIGWLLKKAFLNQDKPKEDSLPKPEKTLYNGAILYGKVGRRKIYFPEKDNKSKILVGASRTGKTTLAKYIACNMPDEYGLCFLDNADGEAINELLRSFTDQQLEKTVVLDHSDPKMPLPFSFLKFEGDIFANELVTEQVVDFFNTNFGLEGQFMTNQLIENACKAVFATQGGTLLDVVRIVEDEEYRKDVLEQLDYWQYEDVLRYWQKYEEKNERDKAWISESFLRRAGILFNSTLLKCTLGYDRQLPYRKWIDEGYRVLIKVPKSLRSACRIIMALHVLNFWVAGLSRDDVKLDDRRMFYIIADEPQAWLSKNEDVLDALFSEAPKYGLVMMLLFQSFEQIKKNGSNSLLRIIIDNQPDFLVFNNAKSNLVDLEPFSPEDLPKYQFICKLRGKEPFLAKALGVPKEIRTDHKTIIKHYKQHFNMPWQDIQRQIRRNQSWVGYHDITERKGTLPRNGLNTSVSRESPQEIKRYSNSSIRIG